MTEVRLGYKFVEAEAYVGYKLAETDEWGCPCPRG